MQVIQGINDFSRNERPISLLLGNFDGIHKGHQSLVRHAVNQARQNGGLAVAMIFNPHPLAVLRPAHPLKLLLNEEQRVTMFKRLDLDILLFTPFNMEIARMAPRAFVEFLVQKIAPAEIVVGFNYSFGHKGEGNVGLLTGFGEEFGFKVTVMPPFELDGEIVSSSLVRSELAVGNVRRGRALLGYYPQSVGVVIEGEKRGRKLGFPTANMGVDPRCIIPQNGVYAAMVGLGRVCHAVVNIGSKPTFHEQYPVAIEAHIMDFSGDLYGQSLKVNFLDKIRGEMKFPDIDALVRQIEQDKQAAIKICNEINDMDVLLS